MKKVVFLKEYDSDFSFTKLYDKNVNGSIEESTIRDYPFSVIKYFFSKKTEIEFLSLDPTKFKPHFQGYFQPIHNRNDYFYLIAFTYFMIGDEYNFEQKTEGIIQINDDVQGFKYSFYQIVYQALQEIKNTERILLRHEFTVLENKGDYINQLLDFLLTDYKNLEVAIRKETNQFVKYGGIIKEIYLELFVDLHRNFIDYIDDERLKNVIKIVLPDKKEHQSFKLINGPGNYDFKNDSNRRKFVSDIYCQLIAEGFVDPNTTYKQIDDLFKYKRRESPQIIWLKDLTSLKTFYITMIDKKIIESSNNNHWNILADYFKLKNSEVKSEELVKKKKSTNIPLCLSLENVFRYKKLGAFT